MYTMADIFENAILCEKCNKKTKQALVARNGFKLRAWQCPSCKKIWYHPLDLQEYENFSKLRSKQFSVKLRMVGNSYTVSIPREIIDFQEEVEREMSNIHHEMNKIIHMNLEEPEKLSLFFNFAPKRKNDKIIKEI